MLPPSSRSSRERPRGGRRRAQPGPVDTDMAPKEGEVAALLKGGTALGRYGRAEDVAAAVGFLATPGVSYITGAC